MGREIGKKKKGKPSQWVLSPFPRVLIATVPTCGIPQSVEKGLEGILEIRLVVFNKDVRKDDGMTIYGIGGIAAVEYLVISCIKGVAIHY